MSRKVNQAVQYAILLAVIVIITYWLGIGF